MRISDWSSDVCSSDLPWVGQGFPDTAYHRRAIVPACREKGIYGGALCRGEMVESFWPECGQAVRLDQPATLAKYIGQQGANLRRVGLDGDEGRSGQQAIGDHVVTPGHDKPVPGREGGEAPGQGLGAVAVDQRSEEHTSELQSLMLISYAVFCLKKKNTTSKKKINELNPPKKKLNTSK